MLIFTKFELLKVEIQLLVELVSKELNHLAAILQYYAGSYICVFECQSQLETVNLKMLHFLFMVNFSVFETLRSHHSIHPLSTDHTGCCS